MADLIMINPASGDKTASLFSGPNSNESIIASVPKGTILKVIGTSGNYYNVEYDNGMPNVTRGGTAMTGTVIAYPYAAMYEDTTKNTQIANINNGTACDILDDTNPSMIKIEAFTTDGLKNGYVQAKYIYRDTEETPVVYRMMRSTARSTGRTGTVNAKSGLKTRTGPGTSYSYVGAYNYGASFTILETKNGWHKVTTNGNTSGKGWGQLDDRWVCATYVTESGTSSSASTSKSDATEVKTSDGDDWVAAYKEFKSGNLSSSSFTANDEYYKQLAEKYAYALGAPPTFNDTVDIRYNDKVDNITNSGRVYNKTILSNPAILSICPGSVKMFPNALGSQKDSIIDAIKDVGSGNSALLEKISKDPNGIFSGRLYKFQAETAEYSQYVNALCRACALMLGIGDELIPDTSTKLKNFDYTYWTIRKKYNPNAASSADKDSSIFRKFWNGLVKESKRIVTNATDDTTYLNFFLNGTETSISESITNGVSDGPLASVLNTVSDTARMINYFTGSGFDTSDSSVDEALNAVISGAGTTIGGISELVKNFANGGRMIFPKMVDNSDYSKTISCNLKFTSPYGDKLSVFLKCIVPICHLIALAFPRQLSDNMYTYPFVIRCSQPGQFVVDLGVIGGMTINRGGNDDTSWTIDTISTEWEVQIEILSLVNDMMITSTKHPLLMCKNEMLLDYLSNFCGFDMMANNLSTKIDMMTSFILNKVLDIPHGIENRLSDWTYNTVHQIFEMTN